MRLRHLATLLALFTVLSIPLSVFAQRRGSSGYSSTAVGGSTYRALTGPPAPSSPSVGPVSNNPFPNGYAPNYSSGAPVYPIGGYVNTNPMYIPVYRPMAGGGGDSDPSVRLNTPEDEAILRAFPLQSGLTPSMSVYQPRPGTDLADEPTSAPASAPATVVVRVPADARVWFDNAATRSTGDERSFETPDLTRGKSYRYDVRATWLQEGKLVERTRTVDVRPGERSVVDFRAP